MQKYAIFTERTRKAGLYRTFSCPQLSTELQNTQVKHNPDKRNAVLMKTDAFQVKCELLFQLL